MSPDLLRSSTARAIAYQFAFAVALAGIFYFLVTNTIVNLQRQGIATGFGFLQHQAGYVVGESFVSHTGNSSFSKIFLIGLLNTLYISILAIFFSTICGIVIGLARLSSNCLLESICKIYVLIFRNIPLLIQIIFWYSLSRQLPAPRQALEPVPGVFLSNRGLVIPWLAWHPAHFWAFATLILCICTGFSLWRLSRSRDHFALAPRRFALITGTASLLLPALVWYLLGAPQTVEIPALQGFNFLGGITFSPELVGLLTALVFYNTAFIAEIVRSGIQSVARGQVEASAAIGLRPLQTMRHVVMPQAVRVTIPPMISQYLNVVKDSTLAVWIGYPELVAVATTAINLTGQAIEPLFIIMVVYLSISLSLSLVMNWYNSRIALYPR